MGEIKTETTVTTVTTLSVLAWAKRSKTDNSRQKLTIPDKN